MGPTLASGDVAVVTTCLVWGPKLWLITQSSCYEKYYERCKSATLSIAHAIYFLNCHDRVSFMKPQLLSLSPRPTRLGLFSYIISVTDEAGITQSWPMRLDSFRSRPMRPNTVIRRLHNWLCVWQGRISMWDCFLMNEFYCRWGPIFPLGIDEALGMLSWQFLLLMCAWRIAEL